MVIKGGSVAGAARFAAHLQRTDTNEIRNEVIEMRDVAATGFARRVARNGGRGFGLPELQEAALSGVDQHAGAKSA